MTFTDDFNAGTPGSPLTGSYAGISEVRYTASGRNGTVGIEDGGPSLGSGAYFQYAEDDTDTLVAQIDFIYTAGTGGFPSSGSISGAGVLYLYGVHPVNGPWSDIMQYDVGVDSGGVYHAFTDYVNSRYSVYPLSTGGWTSTSSDPGRSRPAFDEWRTARATLDAGTLTFEILGPDGTTVIWSYEIDMTDWLVSGCYVGLGYDDTYDRHVRGDNFSYVTTLPAPEIVFAGVDQTDYVLDTAAQTCVFPLDSGVRVGDVIRVRYPYRKGVPLPDPIVPPVLSATSVFSPPRDDLMTSLALPTGTQEGDIIVVTAISGFGGSAQVAISDPRMTRVAHTSTHGAGPGGRIWGVFVGYATTLDPLVVAMQGEYSAWGQFTSGSIMAVRGDGAYLEWDPARVAVGPVYASGTGAMPAVPGSGSGAIATVVGSMGGQLRGSWQSPAMDPYAPAKVIEGDSGTIVHTGFSSQNPTIDATSGAPSVVADWRGVVIGFK